MRNIDRWLNKKVNDPTIGSIYDDTDYALDIQPNIIPITLYNTYYIEDDSDIRNNTDIYLYILDQYEKGEYIPIDDNELDRIEFLSATMERYRPISFFDNSDDAEIESDHEPKVDQNEWKTVKKKTNDKPISSESEPDIPNEKPDNREIDVLIPPNTNRYHANYLFKRMVDYAYENDMIYEIGDLETQSYISTPLVTPSLKHAFYSFCYKNSKHI